MTVTLEEISTIPSVESIKTSALEALDAVGFPVTDWNDLNPARALVESNAHALNMVATFLRDLAQGGYAKLASGQWLDLLFDNNYNETRRQGVFAVKTLRLTNNSLSPITIAVDEYIVTPDDGELLYKNSTGGTLAAPANSVLDLEFKAEFVGSAYNITSSTWELVTAVPGVDVAELPSPTLAVSGSDIETDQEYVARVRAKWDSIGAGATEGFLKYYAFKASDEVKKIKIDKTTPSTIALYLAGDSGPVSTPAVNAVDDAFNTDERRPLCHTLTVASCASFSVSIAGSVDVLASEKATAKANFEKALAAYQKSLAIGAKVSRERIISLIMQQMTNDDRNDLTLTTPSADVALNANEVAAFDVSGLVWVAV